VVVRSVCVSSRVPVPDPAWAGGPCEGVRLGPVRGRGWCDVRNDKGDRWMPWRQEAMKDVARCEKPWGGASDL
jgi:hypothetical protein